MPCWYQVTPANSRADEAVDKLRAFLPADVQSTDRITSIQWSHPEGFQGFIRFEHTAIQSLEIRWVAENASSAPIRLGDVMAEFGAPDRVGIDTTGRVYLQYDQSLLTVWVSTNSAHHLSPDHPVTRLQMLSPHRTGFHRPPQGAARGWNGFSRLP
ncbi:MAG: hypothetical protein GYB66_14385 [Chloroflexi bacterium]|nr:hypothetical protein [Chloroflexota bacterium]